MARRYYEDTDDSFAGLFQDPIDTQDSNSPAITVPDTGEVPVSGESGSSESPREGFNPPDPVEPIDQPSPPPSYPEEEDRGEASTSSAPSPDDGASYTPTRPRTPVPVASEAPAPFTPLDPLMDPSAMSVALKAPYTPDPTAGLGGEMSPARPRTPSPIAGQAPYVSQAQQYAGDQGGQALLNKAGGLLSGGLGLLGGSAEFEDTQGDPLDALIRILTQNG